MKAHIVSLGCPKNLTDSEVLMGQLVSSGHQITLDPKKADIIIVNTCAFLKSAREEARREISKIKSQISCLPAGTAKLRNKRQKLYIAGCLPKYLNGKKVKWLKGVDGFIDSIKLYGCKAPRIKATPPWTAYVKIAEGCNNRCSYCLIPSIRGELKTRPVDDILNEVKVLAKRGVKEIIFVAQDTTAHPGFAELLKKTSKIRGVSWIRIMYTHPLHISNKLIDIIAREKKILKYIDMPIQHASDKILKAMGRKYTKEFIEKLISKMRKKIPGIVIRTSLITGFPGETEEDYKTLTDFINKNKFERLGVFPYSREQGTKAAKFKFQINEKTKKSRADKLMKIQADILKSNNKRFIGRTFEVLVEGKKDGYYFGRTYMDAPDIDGKIYFQSKNIINPGDIIKIEITAAKTYDLVGKTKSILGF